MVGIISVDPSDHNIIFECYLNRDFDKLNKKFSLDTGISVSLYLLPNNDCVAIFGGQTIFENSTIFKYYKKLKSVISCEYIMAVSRLANSNNEFMDACKQANEVLLYRLVKGYDAMLTYDDIINNKYDLANIEEDIEKLERLISDSKYGGSFSNKIDSIFNKDRLKNMSIRAVEDIYYKIISMLERTKVYSNDGMIGADVRRFNRNFKSFRSLSEIRIYLKDIFYSVTQNGKQNYSVVDIARQYIEENYDKNINMAIVANSIDMSYSYFSRVFKEESGKSFSEYLMKIRMEKAARLLDDPVRKVYEVSQNVGYTNPKSFTRAFKRYFGLSPMGYRNKKSN